MKHLHLLQNVIVLGLLLITHGAQAQAPQTFIHKTDDANSSNNVSFISNPLINSTPNGIYLFTHNYSAPGTEGKRHALKVGWYYSGTKWFLYNEDKTPMDTGLGFNIFVPGVGISSWIVTVDTNSNSTGNTVTIDHPKINGDTSAKLFVSSVWNLNGDPKGVYNTHTFGIYYNIITKKWCIFNQDTKKKMVHGASFNIILLDKNSNVVHFTQTYKSGNAFNYATIINHPLANNNPNAHLFITPIWNPKMTLFGTYNNHETGVYYDNGRWAIFNEDLVKMDTGVSFNVMLFPNTSTSLKKHEMTTAINIFPNPLRLGDLLEINMKNPFIGSCQLELIDMTGKTCKTHTFTKNDEEYQEQIQIEGLTKGLYIIKIWCNGFQVSQMLSID